MLSIVRPLSRLLALLTLCLCTLTLFGLSAPRCAAATTYYVALTGSDNGSGTLTAPFLTIQHGINTAVSGDTVTVEDGTYTGPGNVDLDFGGRNITVTSQNGAAKTIIDCQGSSSANHRGFYLHDGETNAVISGFTIQNGYESGLGGGISNGSILAVSNCFITGNTAGYGGGGVCNFSTMTLTNCVFTGNAGGRGGGLYNFYGGALTMTNCTVTGNPSGGIAADNGGITLVNDIFYGDTGGEVGVGSAVASFCDIQGGYTGTGNIDADPLFFDAFVDLHLQSSSSCLGTGTVAGAPAKTIDGRIRPSPPSMGAYEAVILGTTATTTTLASNLNPSVVGQTVTFIAKVAGLGGTPTGTVTFTVDGAKHTQVAISGGNAAYSLSSLSVGLHTVDAIYNGDAIFAASKAPSLNQIINASSTTTTLTSSLNPSICGQQISFTATVTGDNPSGTITFMDLTDGYAFGVGTLSGGTANFITSGLSIESHRIVAVYEGDNNNLTSTSSAITQTVNAVPTTTTLRSNFNPAVYGQNGLNPLIETFG